MKILKPYKNFSLANVTQGYNNLHHAIDSIPFRKEGLGGYGTPLVAPEKVTIGKVYTINTPREDDDNALMKNGFGLWMKGESGYEHLYWHTQPILPVKTGDVVERGTIVAYVGNSGNVYSGGEYVPVEERNIPNFRGTHLHQQVVLSGQLLNPLDFIDMETEPSYTIFDELKAMAITLGKISGLLK